MIGTTIGKYHIVGQLGRGATGIVYRAVDQTLDRDVAIKVLKPELAETDILKRFRAEAVILAKLSHPDIAIIHELLAADGALLMVMELVRGETLEHLCGRVGAMPPDRAVYLVDRILSALGHAHQAGIVHRDVKPANVMVTEFGGVKIMDFGIARIRGAEHMTVDGCTIGTPAYMAPEQVLGEEVDGRSDLYSVGVILYRLLAGRLPFEADTPIAMLQKQMAETAAPLGQHRADLPDWCDAVVARALVKAPGARYQSAEEFRDALARASGITRSTLASGFVVPVRAQEPVRSVEPPQIQTVAVSRTETGSQRRTTVRSLAAQADALVVTLKRAARAREGTMLALLIVAGVFAFLSLGGSPGAPVRFVKADAFPRVVFHAKALVGTGSRQRERDVQVVLGDGRVTVGSGAAADKPLHSVAYGDVVSVTYSRSHHPMWKSPKGPATVVRFNGGTLGAIGIFVDRLWLSIQTDTDDRFIVLRLEEGVARQMLAAIEERTGRTAEVLGGS